jgi:hypothetical protein
MGHYTAWHLRVDQHVRTGSRPVDLPDELC